jgi:hypothetical protein
MDNPLLIANKAIYGQLLTNDERRKLTPELLVNLAIGGQLSLTRSERDRVPPPVPK